MTNQEPHDNIEQTMQTNNNVGARLKYCREQQNLSIDTFVAFSSFPKYKVEALEQGEFKKVGIDTFVTGYIRKYCAWLGENADEYIALYKLEISNQAVLTPEEAVKTTPALSHKKNTLNYNAAGATHSKSSLGKSLPFLFILFVVLFCSILIFFSGNKNNQNDGAQPETNQQPAFNSSPSVEVNVDTLSGKPTAQTNQILAPAVSTIENGLEPASPNTEKPLLAPASLTEPTGVSISDELVSETLAPETLAPETLVAQPQQSETTAKVLRLMFIEDCWLEIKSRDNKVLFAGLKKAGSEHVEVGDTPFEIMLGNARAATVTLNDKSVTFEPIPGKKTLRFNVGN